MFRRNKVIFSPCELDYLKANREIRSVNELSLYLAKSRAAVKRKLDELDGKKSVPRSGKGNKIGKRDDILIDGKPGFFRSGWEANIARILNFKNINWEYEPDIFSFLEHGVKRGTITYCPDFKWRGTYLEVKGYLDGRGRTAIRRFKKFYPEEFKKLKAVVGAPGTKADIFFKELGVPIYAYMRDLTKQYKNKLEHWE